MVDKKDYIERMALTLKRWDSEIDDLKTRAEFADKDEKARLRQMLAELREKRLRGSEILVALHEACADEWDEVRRSAEEILNETAQAFREAA